MRDMSVTKVSQSRFLWLSDDDSHPYLCCALESNTSWWSESSGKGCVIVKLELASLFPNFAVLCGWSTQAQQHAAEGHLFTTCSDRAHPPVFQGTCDRKVGILPRCCDHELRHCCITDGRTSCCVFPHGLTSGLGTEYHGIIR